MMELNLTRSSDLKIRFNMGLIVKVMYQVNHRILNTWTMTRNYTVQKVIQKMKITKLQKWAMMSSNLKEKKKEMFLMTRRNLRIIMKPWKNQLTRLIVLEVKMFSRNRWTAAHMSKIVSKKARLQNIEAHLKWSICQRNLKIRLTRVQ